MATRPVAYLAAPYTHDDARVVAERIRQFAFMATKIEKDGEFHVTSGLYNHLLLNYSDLPGDWAFWGSYSETMLRKSDQCFVLTMPGWEVSTGVGEEIRIATEMGIPITYLNPLFPVPDFSK